ncbi:hypothetical protein [Occallatibacter riparius]|uniref:Uncharacterized protein n=1 Tax=Occallatibacter riparius TaxID=1002689 RepID=A0A9J7BS13_9BACT|nr:hypothetical protein [Occallatibacter riparius]UWZ83837.1 hypothetical protein MOP44_25160 [Occallatibacter riparius]
MLTEAIHASASMAAATNIVGTWDGHVAWGDSGPGVSNATTQWTFNPDGTWTYQFGGGRWIQVEGLVAWNFNKYPTLIYTANVTRNALDGIMGYAAAGSNPGTGSFFAVRKEAGAAAKARVPAAGHDLSVGPHS